MYKEKTAYFGSIIYNQEIMCCACFLSPLLWSPGGFLAWSFINCKLLLGYHSKKSWVETKSKTCCSSKLKWSPMGSANRLSRGLIIACHSWVIVAKQQITKVCEMIMKMPFCEDSVNVEASDRWNIANLNPQTNPLVKVGVCASDCWRVGGTQSESAPHIWELLPALRSVPLELFS